MTEERKLELLAILWDVHEDLNNSFNDNFDKEDRGNMREIHNALKEMRTRMEENANSFGWNIHDWDL